MERKGGELPDGEAAQFAIGSPPVQDRPTPGALWRNAQPEALHLIIRKVGAFAVSALHRAHEAIRQIDHLLRPPQCQPGVTLG
jgi:hypothetical protein